MMWWPLFFIGLLRADDLVVEKYCFNSPSQMEKAYFQYRAIAVPADHVVKEVPCFIINVRPHRRELIQKYLLSNHPDMSISFSSERMRKEPCSLKVEKIKMSVGQDVEGQLSRQQGLLGASASQVTGSETFHVTTLKDFELSVGQDRIQGECRYITPQLYEITLTILKAPEPLGPPAPAGTTVAVNLPPQDQQTSTLKTQIQLSRSNKMEIGNVIKDLVNKSHKLNSKAKIEVSEEVRKVQEKIYLSIL